LIVVEHPAVAERVSKWLGSLPAGWAGARLFEVAEAWVSNVDKHSVDNQAAVRLCNYVDVYKNDFIVESLDYMAATATREQIKRFRIRVGDTLITKDSETADDIGIPAFVEYEAADLISGYHLAIARPDPEKVSPKFLFWALRSEPIARQWGVLASGVTRVGIRSTDLNKVTIPRPPLDEQRAIADFLDRETTQIDALVAKQEELIALLRERGETLFDVEFQTAEGKRRATVRQTLVRLARTPRLDLGVVTAYRDGVVTLRANRRADGYTMSEAEAGYQEVRPGDIVFHALDGFAGAVGISDSLGQCSPVYHVCRPRYDDDPHYLALLIRYLGTSGFLSTQAPSTRQRSVDFRNWGTFARVPLMLPPVEHQTAFVAEIRRQKAGIDSLIAKAQEHIAFTKERRTALITAAVTGQIDLRTTRKAA
jgi:type I restriction enzyme S subunit